MIERRTERRIEKMIKKRIGRGIEIGGLKRAWGGGSRGDLKESLSEEA